MYTSYYWKRYQLIFEKSKYCSFIIALGINHGTTMVQTIWSEYPI